MNVQLQIGYTIYVMNIADAAKVMEMLNKATPCESYWIGEYNGRESESGLRQVKAESISIQQISKEPITQQQYEQRYRPWREHDDARRAAEKAAKEIEA